MDNPEIKTDGEGAAEDKAAQTPSTENVQTATSPADSSNATPLATLGVADSSAPVVTADVIAARLRESSGKSTRTQGGAPLGDRIRRRETDENGEQEKSGKGGRAPRERRERADRPRVERRGPVTSAVLPNRREKLSDDLESEFNAILGADASIDSLMKDAATDVSTDQLEEGTKVSCRVVAIHLETVFVDLGRREQGAIPVKQFPDDLDLAVGYTFDGVVSKFNAEDGVYEISLPFAAAEAGDWLSLSEGAIVEAVVTDANKGGLECTVGKLRAFMPMGQIFTYRVDNPAQFVGERWKCVVLEVNPERRNLVISRRSFLEKEREEQREQTLAELAVGQVREGLVRKIIDVGAFVDLGGVDGFIPISAMSWGRIKHPTDVLKEGERVKVSVVKIDPDRNRISLSFRDAAADPWKLLRDGESDVKVGQVVRGRVTRVADFGAFVELAPGLEGLVHISEIAYQRIASVSDVLRVGDSVDALVLSIDLDKRRVALSMKKTQEDPRIAAAKREADEKAAAEEEQAQKEEAATRERINKIKPRKDLKGGLGSKDLASELKDLNIDFE